MDLEIKDKALKASWLVRWDSNTDWKHAEEMKWFYTHLPIRDPRIWECNLNYKDVETKPDLQLSTSISILQAWCEFNYEENLEDPEDMLMSNLWGNSLICRKNKPLFDESLLNSYLDKVLQMYNFSKKRFHTYEELVAETGVNLEVLYYLGIIAVVPNRWKHEIKNYQFCNEIDRETKLNVLKQIKLEKSVSKYIYWQLLQKKNPKSGANRLIWQNDLNKTITERRWNDLYSNFRRIVKSTKLQFFQYRILSKTLTTNIHRFRWKKVTNNKCTFCKNEAETVIHMLWECEYVQKLWCNLRKKCNYFLGVDVNFTAEIIILNDYEGKNKDMINQLIVMLKHHVYAQKCFDSIPTFPDFMLKLSHWYSVEKHFAYECNNTKKFYKKWKNFF